MQIHIIAYLINSYMEQNVKASFGCYAVDHYLFFFVFFKPLNITALLHSFILKGEDSQYRYDRLGAAQLKKIRPKVDHQIPFVLVYELALVYQ